MSRNAFVDDAAVRDDDDEEYDSDERIREVRTAREDDDEESGLDDSSEEEDDDDEEEARKISEGFIVDEDEEEAGDVERRRRRRKKMKSKKRKHRSDELENGEPRADRGGRDDEDLDEDDLDLVMEATGEAGRQQFKRLKRAGDDGRTGGLDKIFDEADEELESEIEDDDVRPRAQGEMDDFIEDDLSEDEFDRAERKKAQRRTAKAGATGTAIADSLGMDEDAFNQIYEVFGDGTDYQDALDAEEAELEGNDVESKDLAEMFEPSDLKARMMTSEDDIIRITDEPERMQVWRKDFKDVLSEQDFDWMGRWMHDQLWPLFEREQATDPAKRSQTNANLRELHQKAVRTVLDFYSRENLEIPYLWTHRREYLLCKDEAVTYVADDKREGIVLVPLDHLWRLCRLEIRFRAIVERRDTIRKILSAKDIDASVESLLASDKLNSLQDAVDVHDYVNFFYSDQVRDHLQSGSASTQKRATRQTAYAKDRASSLYQVVRAFGISSQQFAENVADGGQKRHHTDDPSMTPENLIEGVEHSFMDWQGAMAKAKDIYVEELLNHPIMRRTLRFMYNTVGQISVRPTDKGKKTIDELHPYYAFKYADELNVAELINAPGMLLQLCRARDEGLVTIDLHLHEQVAIEAKLAEYLLSDGVSDIAELWNNERRQIVSLMLQRAKPTIGRLTLETLRGDCEDRVAEDCRRSFLTRLNQSRPAVRDLDQARDVPRVLAISNGQGQMQRAATVMVVVDDRGKVVHSSKVVTLRAEDGRRHLSKVIADNDIELIAVSGYSTELLRLKGDIDSTIEEMLEQDAARSRPRPRVVFVNDEVARLYQGSERAESEYPQLPKLLRYCVALGHYCQSPLHEYVALEKDLLSSLKFHPHQALIPPEKLLAALESAMVDIVNLVGVDINYAQESVYERNLLQYVSGLGPRKAEHLLHRIGVNGGYLRSRTDMLTQKSITKTIFVNCASFLRLPFDMAGFRYASADDRKVMDILDQTRIHPEDYELANKMAMDATDLDEEDTQHLDGGPVYQMRVDGTVDKIQDLILEEYAEELLRAFNQPKLLTLRLIAEELEHPYAEKRHEFRTLTSGQIFEMATGETPEQLGKDTVISATIRRFLPRGDIVARTASGLDVEIYGSDTDVPQGADIEAVYGVDQTVQCVVLELDREMLRIKGSMKAGDIERARKEKLRQILQARGTMKWAEYEEEKDQNSAKEALEARERQTRVIKHPLFRQFTARQAEEFLGGMQRGDAVIRPSGKGPDHIAITWKVADGIFQHLDVLELDKDSTHSVGKSLRVGSQKYSDLDELIVSHVRAMARKVDELSTHDKFQRGSKADTEQYLNKYSEANPRRSCYAFCFNHQHPGYFDLCFKANPRSKVGQWPVKVVPNAFMMRDNLYADMNQLCNGFKMMFARQAQDQARR